MRTEPAPCPICEARADTTRVEEDEYAIVSCWTCGSFRISDGFEAELKNLPGRSTPGMSGPRRENACGTGRDARCATSRR